MPQRAWLATIALPSSRSRSAAAARICPGWPRSSLMRASNGLTLPFKASTDNAPAAIAAANTRSPVKSASRATAVDICVPLISANPSLGPSRSGSQPSFSSAGPAGMIWPATSMLPWPISAAIKWARGARSPEAPTLPCDGMIGMASRSSSA